MRYLIALLLCFIELGCILRLAYAIWDYEYFKSRAEEESPFQTEEKIIESIRKMKYYDRQCKIFIGIATIVDIILIVILFLM